MVIFNNQHTTILWIQKKEENKLPCTVNVKLMFRECQVGLIICLVSFVAFTLVWLDILSLCMWLIFDHRHILLLRYVDFLKTKICRLKFTSCILIMYHYCIWLFKNGLTSFLWNCIQNFWFVVFVLWKKNKRKWIKVYRNKQKIEKKVVFILFNLG